MDKEQFVKSVVRQALENGFSYTDVYAAVERLRNLESSITTEFTNRFGGMTMEPEVAHQATASVRTQVVNEFLALESL